MTFAKKYFTYTCSGLLGNCCSAYDLNWRYVCTFNASWICLLKEKEDIRNRFDDERKCLIEFFVGCNKIKNNKMILKDNIFLGS